ncbi:MAG TPA: DUF3267 domain-containing protein [Tenuifilaceae bacterium]|nr:hypothetical protein [Bacteroidales bacterium]HNS29735.1 DUF3267 domain-containing protein [Tenuifilaceae bacterium]
MESPDEKRKEFTMGALRINLLSFLCIIPVSILFLVPFIAIWGSSALLAGKAMLLKYLLPIFILGIIVHEGLHGVAWACYAKNGFKSIRFGINWKYLAPYCHCKEPLSLKGYALGAALPLVVTGITPSLIALVIGNGFLVCLGFLFTLAATGDAIMLVTMRRLKKDALIADHPDKIGYFVIDND